jgi:NarL family two-component system response regulator LiaR
LWYNWFLKKAVPVTGIEGGMMAIRLLIVEDHSVVREGLRMYLQAEPVIEIVGEASDGRGAIELARSLNPDVVLMDLILPGMDGIAATHAIRSELPQAEVVAMTSVLEDAAIPEAINAGAIAYVLKDTRPQELRRAILAAHAGQVVFAAGSVKRLVAGLHVSDVAPALLDWEQRGLLRLIATGHSDEEMARDLGVDVSEVQGQVRRLLHALQVLGRAQALLYAVQHGIAAADEIPAFASHPLQTRPGPVAPPKAGEA